MNGASGDDREIFAVEKEDTTRDWRIKWFLKTEFNIVSICFWQNLRRKRWNSIESMYGNKILFSTKLKFLHFIHWFIYFTTPSSIIITNNISRDACYVNSGTCYYIGEAKLYLHHFRLRPTFCRINSLFGERWFLARTFVSCFFIASCLCFALAICPGNYRHTKYIPRKTLIRRGCRQCK